MPETELTEMVDFEADRVDAVPAGANGMPFLVLKADAESFDYEAVVKAKYTQKEVDALGAKGQALKDDTGDHYSYPIADTEDLGNAIKAVGMGNADHDKIRAYIIKRAKALGASDQIPENWSSDGSNDAKKADGETKDCPTCDGSGKIRAGHVQCPDCDGSGQVAKEASEAAVAKDDMDGSDPANDEPGSAEWEAQDAALLRDLSSQLTGALSKLNTALDRESTEMNSSGGDYDADDVWQLSDAAAMLNAVIGICAAMSFHEAQESLDAGGVSKAGRRLSARSVSALTEARQTITDLLGEFGDTPNGSDAAPTETGDPIVTDEETLAVATKLAEMAQFDAAVKAAEADAAASATADEAPVVEPAVEETPAVEKTEEAPTTEEKPAESDPAEAAVAKALEEANEAHAAVVKGLEERLAKLESKPDYSNSPFLNGAAGAGDPQDTPEIAAVQKAADEEQDPARKAVLTREASIARVKQRMFGG